MSFADSCYWNNRTYGSAIKIRKSVVMGILIFLCIVTPATNWAIPIVVRKSKDIIVRYEK